MLADYLISQKIYFSFFRVTRSKIGRAWTLHYIVRKKSGDDQLKTTSFKGLRSNLLDYIPVLFKIVLAQFLLKELKDIKELKQRDKNLKIKT